MKRLPFGILALVLAAMVVPAQPAGSAERSVRVLFIGNSLTSANNLPAMVADMARSRGHGLQYDIYAPGGYRLLQHAKDPKALAKIRQGNWDFVVLQEHGQCLGFSQAEIEVSVYPYVAQLDQAIKMASPKATIVYYMTMARKSGDLGHISISHELKTYAGTQHRVDKAYIDMARVFPAVLAPVGLAWEDFRAQNPSIDLYADEAHPNIKGSYLAACVIYETLFKENSQGLPHPAGIDDMTAALIQNVTHHSSGRPVGILGK